MLTYNLAQENWNPPWGGQTYSSDRVKSQVLLTHSSEGCLVECLHSTKENAELSEGWVGRVKEKGQWSSSERHTAGQSKGAGDARGSTIPVRLTSTKWGKLCPEALHLQLCTLDGHWIYFPLSEWLRFPRQEQGGFLIPKELETAECLTIFELREQNI